MTKLVKPWPTVLEEVERRGKKLGWSRAKTERAKQDALRAALRRGECPTCGAHECEEHDFWWSTDRAKLTNKAPKQGLDNVKTPC